MAQDTLQRPSRTQCALHLHGFDSADLAKRLGAAIAHWTGAVSQRIDLRSLDGITVAFDYAEALRNLDRGYVTQHILKPTNTDRATGVAMTARVKRDGKLKSHIVLEAQHALGILEDSDGPEFARVLYTIAHECAHVEVTSRFATAFPGFLLDHQFSVLDSCKWNVVVGCWDEYAATRISAPYGHGAKERTESFQGAFLHALEQTQPRVAQLISEYREHKISHAQVLESSYAIHGDLLKYAGYHLGNIDGLGLSLDGFTETRRALERSWFADYFVQLKDLCEEIFASYGKWTDLDAFGRVGSMAARMVAHNGVRTYRRKDGSIYVDVPFRGEMVDGVV